MIILDSYKIQRQIIKVNYHAKLFSLILYLWLFENVICHIQSA